MASDINKELNGMSILIMWSIQIIKSFEGDKDKDKKAKQLTHEQKVCANLALQ